MRPGTGGLWGGTGDYWRPMVGPQGSEIDQSSGERSMG